MSKDYSFLKPGLRWIRMKIDSRGNPGRWVVAEFSGQAPFLKCEIAFDPAPEIEQNYLPDPTINPDDWEYGPELIIPSDKWLEMREAPKSVPATFSLRNRSDD